MSFRSVGSVFRQTFITKGNDLHDSLTDLLVKSPHTNIDPQQISGGWDLKTLQVVPLSDFLSINDLRKIYLSYL